MLIPAEEWLKSNIPDENMIWKSGPGQQISFGNELARMLMSCERADSDYTYNQSQHMVKVVSTHRSKSVDLPVLFMEWKGIKFYWRDNFHDIKMSIVSDRKLNVDFEDIFTDDCHSSCYFEGFEGDWIHGSYAKNKSKWSMSLNDFSAKVVTYKIWHHVRTEEQQASHPSHVIREFLDWLTPELAKKRDIGKDLLEHAKEMENSPNFVHGYGRISTLMSLAFRWKNTQETEDAAYTKMFGRPRFKDEWELKREAEEANKPERG